jgi:hypothetical protein
LERSTLAIATLLLAAPATGQGATPAPDLTSQFDCIELEVFKVDYESVQSTEEERAKRIPQNVLLDLRNHIADEIPKQMPGMKTRKLPEQQCDDAGRSLVFGGRVTDFKKGNQAARYFVSFGAGKQKFEVDALLKRKGDGSILKQGRVVDRKIGGFFGGSKDKGQRDFAEKIADFIHTGVSGKRKL